MKNNQMVVSGWKTSPVNNTTGSGYGIRISYEDREKFFDPDWGNVFLELPNGIIIQPNFTPAAKKDKDNKPCIELRKKEIGKWMLDNNYAPWPYRKPPHFKLEYVGKKHFKLFSKI